MFDIADVTFAQVSDEEKKVYAGKMKETGSYQGYKLRNYWVGHFLLQLIKSQQFIITLPSLKHIDNGVHDQLEHYNSKQSLHLSGFRFSLINPPLSQQGHHQESPSYGPPPFPPGNSFIREVQP